MPLLVYDPFPPSGAATHLWEVTRLVGKLDENLLIPWWSEAFEICGVVRRWGCVPSVPLM